MATEEAFGRAMKDAKGRPIRFRRFVGEGKIEVAVGARTYAELLSGTGKMRIRPAPHDPAKNGKQSRVHVVEIDQTIPRKEKRMIRCVAVMHRVLPDDAIVRRASIVVRRVGRRVTCSLQITAQHPSFAEPKRPSGTRSPTHVQIGWSRVPTGVRVAMFAGHEVVVPDRIIAQHEYAAQIRSVADDRFDMAKRMLRRFVAMGPNHLNAWHLMRGDRGRHMLRTWCMQYARYVFGDSLHEMWRDWKRERKSRGEDLYADPQIARRMMWPDGTDSARAIAWWCWLWAQKDAHLCTLAVDSLRRYADRRDHHYRAEAIRIATEFASVTVDNYNIAGLRELPVLTMPGEVPNDVAQHNAHAAAPGRFREILCDVMGSRCEKIERPGGIKSAATARAAKSKKKSGLSEAAA